MEKHTLGVILFPAIAVASVALLVNGFGVMVAGDLEREPTIINRIIGLILGCMTMTILYAIPKFQKWIPNRENLGSSIWPVFVAVIFTFVVGACMYLLVVNEALQWTTSPTWLDGKQVLRGMCFVVLCARWYMKWILEP